MLVSSYYNKRNFNLCFLINIYIFRTLFNYEIREMLFKKFSAAPPFLKTATLKNRG
jgi:hypothetical protein